MALEALVSNNDSNLIIYDTISATENNNHDLLFGNNVADAAVHGSHLDGLCPLDLHVNLGTSSMMLRSLAASNTAEQRPNWAAQGRKRRRRRPRICKNKEEAETQRMTHITVERNRRKQMNDHLSVLRSLMPEYYIHRGDQASVVGSAIDFVKELEQHLQSLEARKRIQQQQKIERGEEHDMTLSTTTASDNDLGSPPFAQFFTYPQYSWCHVPRGYPVGKQRAVADIEATMIETHVNLRILSRKRSRQLIKMVAAFQSIRLTVLHLSVTSLDPFVLYSFSVKVEEGCHLSSADDIAGAVHHMLTIIEEEADLCSTQEPLQPSVSQLA
ncbi:transcription factor bHLH71-like [Magnolia sinica]|uniref:transcription factor bHLH71-like n=1 Tax=Magnolia sinica TaxID=86752 RepID=UPI00265A6B99|nr:transcription factor bHLH71-like [Magnolia sinica]